MSKERDLKLKEKYPAILKNLGGKPNETCMSWAHGGLAIGDGWLPLVEQLMDYLQFQHDKNGYPQCVFEQVKEKFGSLRVYVKWEACTSNTAEYGIKFNRTAENLQNLIDFVSFQSSKVCELCGQPGSIRGEHWVQCRCDDCLNPLPKLEPGEPDPRD